jgi:hypothetical protein
VQGTNISVPIVAAVAAFVASVVWYTPFGGAVAALRDMGPAESGAPIWAMLFVIAQNLILALMIAYLVSHLGVASLAGAVGLGALLWIFPAAILLGSVVHEGVPPTLAGIHAGDWLAKLILIAAIVSI